MLLEIVNENGNRIELAQNMLLEGLCVSCCETYNSIAQDLPFINESFGIEHKIRILISDFYVNIIRMPRLGMLFEQRTVLPCTAFEQGRCRKIRVSREVSPGKSSIITDI